MAVKDVNDQISDLTDRIHKMDTKINVMCPIENPNYKMISQRCYYFEATKKTFSEAQENCAAKFGILGGHLAEPKTAEISVESNKYAEKVVNSNYYWIGYDRLGQSGNWEYSSTRTISTIKGCRVFKRGVQN